MATKETWDEEVFLPDEETVAPKRKRSPTPGPQPTSFWLDEDTKRTLDHLTGELGMNRSAVVREAIRRMVSDDNSAEVRRLVAELGRAVAGKGGGV